MSAKRFYEIFPGFLTWSAILFPLVLSSFAPKPVVIFILLFDLYWVYKSLIMGIHLITGYNKMKQQVKIDWSVKLKTLAKKSVNLDKIYHVIILPTYKETLETLEPSIESITSADNSAGKMIFILATEKRDQENARKIAKILRKKYQKYFWKFIITEHPVIRGEVKAKGANVTWAGRKLSLFLRSQHVSNENVIVTTADADTRFHKKFFDCLTYNFITNPNRHRRSFQPIPIYANNIWHAAVFARILAFGSSFWQIIESTRPWRLINFSTHSVSLKALEEMDYWDTGVVNEDSRQFWRAYYKFDGDHQVVPLFFPVFMDAVYAKSFKLTVKNQYLQRLRWAYGIEHSPYIWQNTFKKNKIPFWDKFVRLFRFMENNFSWATASIFIAILGWIPLVLNPGFGSTVLAFNVRFYSSYLLSLAWIGLLVSAIISMKLLPPRPQGMHKLKWLEMFAQWVFIPIVAILFSSIPAIDAQTRLMLGKYLGFRVTDKEVVR
ncbi:MAG: Uncharacterized protein CEN89_769 [Candidatus Berkelbacteria bacterium Licking1014_7]|uniref:Uncharacterized protein n=1 Tax=Candidatus Berkelbacteria bacterium Licking1014_7 TaxID=2017147 RepID=A0A554LHF2_9BACT|nr:MAG: Uncharacterized protein CEN89_769 [Candidatus Berkelbacteria bacterium Licking1014_7]